MNLLNFSIEEKVLLITLAISFIIQFYFLIFKNGKLAFFKPKAIETTTHPALSVIICAKNEASNLKQFLPTILQQDYPDYEVIVVNDGSEDDTELILSQFKQEYPHLYYTTIPIDRKFTHGKKLAVSIGIKAANNEHLVFTDADCYTNSNQWLKEMSKGFSNPKIEIVLGFGGYEKQKGFTNLLVRYDTFFTAIQYLSYALSRKAYMGVGRNLAYRKSLFTKNNGLLSHMHIASGDDDLFISQTATKDNTLVCISHNSHTVSIPPRNLRMWKDQKSRHLTTAHYHKTSTKFGLILEPISRFLLILSSIYLIFNNNFLIIATTILLSKYIIQLLLWRKVSKLLNQGRLYWSLLFFDIIHPLFLMWAYTSSLRRNKNRWK